MQSNAPSISSSEHPGPLKRSNGTEQYSWHSPRNHCVTVDLGDVTELAPVNLEGYVLEKGRFHLNYISNEDYFRVHIHQVLL